MSIYDSSMAGQFTELLAKREDELRQALAALSADDEPAAPHEVSDFKDVALRSTDAAVDDLQAERIERSLQQVVAAQRRLATEQFGICLDCGEAMDLRRLLALPEAELCTECQSKHEQFRH